MLGLQCEKGSCGGEFCVCLTIWFTARCSVVLVGGVNDVV